LGHKAANRPGGTVAHWWYRSTGCTRSAVRAGARLQTFPGSSHCPFWEEADAFNAAVAAFAAEVAG
jgi:pimeloyl-ACP methyl ester carboxylesterase